MPGRSCDPARPASSSSWCRSGSRARARPSAESPSRSRRCSGCGWCAGGERLGKFEAKCGELVASRRTRAATAVQSAQLVLTCSADLEARGLIRGGLGVGERGVRVDVGGAAHALPVGDRAAAGAGGLVLVEAPRGAAVAVVVAGHHHGRLLVAGQEPEPRQRPAVGVHLPDQVREQVLLLVGLRDRDLVQVHPVGLGIAGGMPRRRGRRSGSARVPSRSWPAQAGLPWRV